MKPKKHLLPPRARTERARKWRRIRELAEAKRQRETKKFHHSFPKGSKARIGGWIYDANSLERQLEALIEKNIARAKIPLRGKMLETVSENAVSVLLGVEALKDFRKWKETTGKTSLNAWIKARLERK
ncbi:MAG: hypothetical protein QXK06_01740 [Candidatus Diapherotrites archaeon]